MLLMNSLLLLQEAADKFARSQIVSESEHRRLIEAFKAGAEWNDERHNEATHS